jgi:uncharacterized protein YbcV (DUF1398 family)
MASGIDVSVIRQCTQLSFERPGSFPEVLRRLSAIGVERYHADLTRLTKTYYGSGGAGVHEGEPLPLPAPPPIADHFSAAAVEEAVRATQAARISYAEFLRGRSWPPERPTTSSTSPAARRSRSTSAGPATSTSSRSRQFALNIAG